MKLDLTDQQVIDLYFAALRSPDVTVKRTAEPLKPYLMEIAAKGGDLRLPLTNGAYAVIDAADLALVMERSWFLMASKQDQENSHAYAGSRDLGESGKQVTLRLHRVLLDAPADMMVDHIDHDGLNNRRSNLRLATRGQNRANGRKAAGCSSRYLGVSIDRQRQKLGYPEIWQAAIAYKDEETGRKVTVSAGVYLTEEDAARAYNDLAVKIHGEFANLNTIAA